ncbi:MAG: type II toxin-antitoxin system VapC family toxin [Thermoleophilaceae bacterium]
MHGLESEDFDAALALLDEHAELHTRDAVHVGTARNRGIELIVSTDADFDPLPGLERIDPSDPHLLARLAAG